MLVKKQLCRNLSRFRNKIKLLRLFALSHYLVSQADIQNFLYFFSPFFFCCKILYILEIWFVWLSSSSLQYFIRLNHFRHEFMVSKEVGDRCSVFSSKQLELLLSKLENLSCVVSCFFFLPNAKHTVFFLIPNF